LDTYDPARPLRPWLFGVALRVVLDHRKRVRRRREVPSDEDRVDPRPLADHLVELSQESQLVMRALDTLDLQRRAVFVMSELGGHTMPEIAETLSVPLNTAYSRLRLARQDFESAVRRLQPARRAP
jgi:RNA polymerase sigma-70 factor (ECF subfamily)